MKPLRCQRALERIWSRHELKVPPASEPIVGFYVLAGGRLIVGEPAVCLPRPAPAISQLPGYINPISRAWNATEVQSAIDTSPTIFGQKTPTRA